MERANAPTANSQGVPPAVGAHPCAGVRGLRRSVCRPTSPRHPISGTRRQCLRLLGARRPHCRRHCSHWHLAALGCFRHSQQRHVISGITAQHPLVVLFKPQPPLPWKQQHDQHTRHHRLVPKFVVILPLQPERKGSLGRRQWCAGHALQLHVNFRGAQDRVFVNPTAGHERLIDVVIIDICRLACKTSLVGDGAQVGDAELLFLFILVHELSVSTERSPPARL